MLNSKTNLRGHGQLERQSLHRPDNLVLRTRGLNPATFARAGGAPPQTWPQSLRTNHRNGLCESEAHAYERADCLRPLMWAAEQTPTTRNRVTTVIRRPILNRAGSYRHSTLCSPAGTRTDMNVQSVN